MNWKKLIGLGILSFFLGSNVLPDDNKINNNVATLCNKLLSIDYKTNDNEFQTSIKIDNRFYLISFNDYGIINKVDSKDVLNIKIIEVSSVSGSIMQKEFFYSDKCIDGIKIKGDDQYSYKLIVDGKFIRSKGLSFKNEPLIDLKYSHIISKLNKYLK